MTEVKLTYYKLRGKYYSEGAFETTRKSWHDVVDDVRFLQRAGRLPGLVTGCREFVVLMQPGEPWGVSHLFMPPMEHEFLRDVEKAPESTLLRAMGEIETSMQSQDWRAELGRVRVLLRALFADLLDEHLPLGELQRIVLSIRRSVWEQDQSTLAPSGAMGLVADELMKKLCSEVNPKEYPDDL